METIHDVEPHIVLLPFLAYIKRAWGDGVRSLSLGYGAWGAVWAWDLAARLPWYGVRLLAHERWHFLADKGNADHAPWWTFRIECGHFLRLRDPAGILRP